MAKYNEILVGRYNQFLQKIFGIKGPAPAPQLGGDIQVSFPLWSGVETRLLESWFRYACAVAVGPVVGQGCNFRMRNPAGSNVIAVLEKVAATPSLNDIFAIGRQSGAGVLPIIDLTVAQQGFEIDLRAGSFVNQNSQVRVSRDTGQTAVQQPFEFANALALTTYEFITDTDHQIVLAPGEVFELSSGTLNGKVWFSAFWRERILEEGEVRV